MNQKYSSSSIQSLPQTGARKHGQLSENLANDLGRLLGVGVSFSQGASVLTLADDREIWLEFPHDSALFIVHTSLKDNVSGSIQEVTQCLELNAQPNVLKGAYISFHRETRSLRLCVSLPTDVATAELISGLIKSMTELAGSLSI